MIGIYLPVTGSGSELGQPMIAAVEDAVQMINDAGGVLGNDVEAISSDEGAGTGPGELLSAGVDAIVGPASSLTALSQLAPAVDANTGVVVCSPSATSLLLDNYPDNTFLFRTAPSDSLQMAAIARQVQRTGARSVAVGYLDDPYGRGLLDAFLEEAEARRLAVAGSVGFSGDQTDLSGSANEVLNLDAGVIVVLGDSDDGGRLLAALDTAGKRRRRSSSTTRSVRRARPSNRFPPGSGAASPGWLRWRTDPATTPRRGSSRPTPSTASISSPCRSSRRARIAPRTFRTNMAGVSADGRGCSSFETCEALLEQGLNIDYDGASGSAELANATGDPVRAWFESFELRRRRRRDRRTAVRDPLIGERRRRGGTPRCGGAETAP